MILGNDALLRYCRTRISASGQIPSYAGGSVVINRLKDRGWR